MHFYNTPVSSINSFPGNYNCFCAFKVMYKKITKSCKYNFLLLKTYSPTCTTFISSIWFLVYFFHWSSINTFFLKITTAFVHFEECTKCLEKVAKITFCFIWNPSLHHSLHVFYSFGYSSGMNPFCFVQKKILSITI